MGLREGIHDGSGSLERIHGLGADLIMHASLERIHGRGEDHIMHAGVSETTQ